MLRAALVAITPEEITVRVGAEERRVPLKTVLSAKFGAVTLRPPGKPAAMVEFVDQSFLAAAAATVQGTQATFALFGGATVHAPTAAVRSVRFLAAGEPLESADKQWNEILSGKVAADLLVVRKKGALDYLEGVLQDLGPEELKFQVDKDVVSVKRPKVEGIVYYHPAGAKLAAPICEVALVGGTRLAAGSIKIADGVIQLTTPAGATASAPISDLRELDFSAGKVRFLGDLEPDILQFASYFSAKEPLESWDEFFQMRRNRGPQPGPLRLGGKSYAKGLSLRSRTRAAYRLPGAFSRLEALVGMDDSAGEDGVANLVIRGDGKSLWEREIRSGGEPQTVDVSIAGVKRLEIFVDFGQDLDIGDFVDLCDVRVSK
jgi:hypothetical protein